MLRPELIHPMIVHFPIVLIVAAFCAFAAYALTRKDFFARVGAWAITLGALSAGAAVLAGFVAEDNAAHNEAAHEILEHFHEPLALAALALSGFLSIWGFASRWKLAGGKLIAYVVILFATVVTLGFTGHYGAMMVYEHGMGVNPAVLRPIVHEHEHPGGGHPGEGYNNIGHHDETHETGGHDVEAEDVTDTVTEGAEDSVREKTPRNEPDPEKGTGEGGLRHEEHRHEDGSGHEH